RCPAATRATASPTLRSRRRQQRQVHQTSGFRSAVLDEQPALAVERKATGKGDLTGPASHRPEAAQQHSLGVELENRRCRPALRTSSRTQIVPSGATAIPTGSVNLPVPPPNEPQARRKRRCASKA